jgi:hypothetical protein
MFTWVTVRQEYLLVGFRLEVKKEMRGLIVRIFTIFGPKFTKCLRKVIC